MQNIKKSTTSTSYFDIAAPLADFAAVPLAAILLRINSGNYLDYYGSLTPPVLLQSIRDFIKSNLAFKYSSDSLCQIP